MTVRILLTIFWVLAAVSAPLAQPMVPGGIGPMQSGASSGGSGPVPPAQYVTGPLGSGLVMTGQTDLVLPTSTSLQACCSLTVSVLVKTTGLSGANTILLFSAETYPFSGFIFAYVPSVPTFSGPALIFSILPAGGANTATCTNGRLCLSPASVNDGNPHLISFTYESNFSNEGGPISLYIDGALVLSGSVASGYAGTQLAYNVLSGFVGTAIDLRYYAHRALSAAEVSSLWALYQSNLTAGNLNPLNTGLTGWWPMDASNIVGNQVLELSGNNNTMFFDNTTPTVAVTSPAPSPPSVSGTTTLTATATDVGGIGIEYVQFSIDGVLFGPQIFSAPYTTPWNTVPYIDTTYMVTATAVGVNGVSAMDTISVTTSNGTVPTNWYFANAGNDSWDCKAPAFVSGTNGPCQTISKLNASAYKAGDLIHPKGGDTFAGCILLSPSNVTGVSNTSFPTTIVSYGAGSYTLNANCTTGVNPAAISAITIHDISNTLLDGGTLVGDGNQLNGISIVVEPPFAITNNVVQNFTNITNFYTTANVRYGSEIYIQADNGSNSSITNFAALNNTLCPASPTSPDDNGVIMQSFGLNIINPIFRGNIACNIGGKAGGNNGAEGLGFNSNGGQGGHWYYNLAHTIGAHVNTCGGGSGFEFAGVNGMLHEFFESYGNLTVFPGCDGGGTDFDGSVTNSIGQYGYTHDNTADGHLLWGGSAVWGPNTYRYMISENDCHMVFNGGCGSFQVVGGGHIMNYYNNVVWASFQRSASQIAPIYVQSIPGGGDWINNIFAAVQNLGTNANDCAIFNNLNPAGLNFKNNDWYAISGGSCRWYQFNGVTYTGLAAWQAVAPGGDTGAQAVNPGLVGGGTGGTLTWTPSTQASWPPATNQPAGYALSGGSPMISAGYGAIVSPGTRDYYGNTIPGGGGCFNIGAYGVCP